MDRGAPCEPIPNTLRNCAQCRQPYRPGKDDPDICLDCRAKEPTGNAIDSFRYMTRTVGMRLIKGFNMINAVEDGT